MPPDASKVKVQGPGIEPGNVVGEQTYFDVLTAGRLGIKVLCLDCQFLPLFNQSD